MILVTIRTRQPLCAGSSSHTFCRNPSLNAVPVRHNSVPLLQVAKAMPRVVENVHDRLPADSALAIGLARLWTKGEKPFFQLVTENKDTPKQVRMCHHP